MSYGVVQIREAWALYQSRDFAKAGRVIDAVLRRDARNPHAWQLRAMLLMADDKGVEAEYAAKHAIACSPTPGPSYSTLGSVYLGMKRFADAETAFVEALKSLPDAMEVHYNLGLARRILNKVSSAEEHFRRVAARGGGLALSARQQLASLMMYAGRAGEAFDLLRELSRLRPGELGVETSLATVMNYLPDLDAGEVTRQHRLVGGLIARGAPKLPALEVQELEVRATPSVLRVGYLSGDFREHSVSYFIEPVLRAHDRQRFHVTCYFSGVTGDAVTERLRGLADEWRDVGNLSDQGVAELIRRDGIDILVDLSGFEVGNRLGVMAAGPAPVQATYLGYPNTTGVPAIGWRIVDSITDPPGAELRASERLARLDGCFLCYGPRSEPAVGACPEVQNGRVTFGSFNTLMKITPPMIAAWSEILRGVPGGRLLLKAGPLGESEVRERYARDFAAHGITADRLEFMGYAPSHRSHLELYGRVDIGLDPFPYTGTTTTCEAMWMGVPVVTMIGDRHAGRVGASLLTAVGLDILIAEDRAGYVGKAVALAGDRARRGELRAGLREKMRGSMLMDAAGFTRKLEELYVKMWQVRGSPG